MNSDQERRSGPCQPAWALGLVGLLIALPAAEAYYDTDEQYVRDVCLARGVPSAAEGFAACVDTELAKIADRRRWDPGWKPYRTRPEPRPVPPPAIEPEPPERYVGRHYPYYYWPPPYLHPRPPHWHPPKPHPPPPPPPPNMRFGSGRKD